MAEPYVRPDTAAVEELEVLVRHVLDELAGWRRRCLKAEAEVQAYRARAGGTPAGMELSQATERIVELETENENLRQRVDGARERVQALAGRLSFLEQGVER
jgi:hypothetical protein